MKQRKSANKTVNVESRVILIEKFEAYFEVLHQQPINLKGTEQKITFLQANRSLG
jgi:hypothetical protein